MQGPHHPARRITHTLLCSTEDAPQLLKAIYLLDDSELLASILGLSSIDGRGVHPSGTTCASSSVVHSRSWSALPPRGGAFQANIAPGDADAGIAVREVPVGPLMMNSMGGGAATTSLDHGRMTNSVRHRNSGVTVGRRRRQVLHKQWFERYSLYAMKKHACTGGKEQCE